MWAWDASPPLAFSDGGGVQRAGRSRLNGGMANGGGGGGWAVRRVRDAERPADTRAGGRARAGEDGATEWAGGAGASHALPPSQPVPMQASSRSSPLL